jgi:SAM-dependent methyltransferase
MTAREWFDRAAPEYDARSSRGLLGLLKRRERRTVLRLLAPRPGDSILDAGCGSGFDAVPLRARGCEVVGVDASPEMVRIARSRGVDARVGDLANLELGRRFHKVLACGVLEFCDDPSRVIDRLANHLDAKGSLVLLFPMTSPAGSLYRLYHRRHGVRVHLFETRDLERWVEAAGLRVRAFERTTPFTGVLVAGRG